jgi:hypothetical protein
MMCTRFNYMKESVSVMPSTDKISTLTKKDRMLIDIILIGSTKLISGIIYSDSKRQARASYNLETKPLALNSILIGLPELIERKPHFRPADIRSMLPSDETKNIQSSDLTRILDFLVYIKILERIPRDSRTEKTRLPGHPSKYDETRVRLSGPNSRYKPSSYYYNLKRILSKPEALTWIHTLLLESGLLYKYRRKVHLFIIETIRNKKYDREKAWKVCKSTFSLSSKEEADFNNYYQAIKKIRDSNELTALAEKKALVSLRRHSAEDYVKIYMIGALNYQL